MTKEELQNIQYEDWTLFKRVFGSPDGEKVLERLKKAVRYDHPVFMSFDKEERIDTHLAAYRDGRKAVVSEIIAIMQEPEFLTKETPQCIDKTKTKSTAAKRTSRK